MRALLLVAAVALIPAGAAAQSGDLTRDFGVTGSVPGACASGAPRLAPGAQITFLGLNGSTLQIDRLVDPTTLSTSAASAEVQFPASCAFPHRVRLESQNNGLWQTSERGAQPPEGFGHAVPYRALVQWAAENLRLDADAKIRRIADGSVFVENEASGDLLLRLEIDPGATNTSANAPLLAGVYGDTLRITLEPLQ